MKRFLLLIPVTFLLQACTATDCEVLTYEQSPEVSEPLKFPGDTREPTPSGEFRVPDTKGDPRVGDCLAQPPMTLPPEAIMDPDDLEEEGEESDG